MKNKKKPILLALAALFILLQFFQIDKTNPPVDTNNDYITMQNPPTEIAEMMRTSCYDCHSNETVYPWYTYVQPVGWWVQKHIRAGKKGLNYSEWRQCNEEDKPSSLKEMAEEVEETKMPLLPYWLAHWDAKLNEEKRKKLVAYFEGMAKK